MKRYGASADYDSISLRQKDPNKLSVSSMYTLLHSVPLFIYAYNNLWPHLARQIVERSALGLLYFPTLREKNKGTFQILEAILYDRGYTVYSYKNIY